MIFAEILFLIGIIFGGIFGIIAIAKYIRYKNSLKEKAKSDLQKALEKNSRHSLENVLIIHEKYFSKEVIDSVKYRIAELSNKESDQNLTFSEWFLKSNLKKPTNNHSSEIDDWDDRFTENAKKVLGIK